MLAQNTGVPELRKSSIAPKLHSENIAVYIQGDSSFTAEQKHTFLIDLKFSKKSGMMSPFKHLVKI
jgi:hypothetical protein